MNPPKNYKLELYHDTLARKIMDRASRDDKLRLQLERLVRDKFNFYQSGQGGLLAEEELSLIHTYRDSLSLKPEYLPYLQKSEAALQAAKQAELRRLRNRLLAAISVALVVSLLALIAWRQRGIAQDNEDKALVEKQRAEQLAEQEAASRLQADILSGRLGLANDSLEIAKAESDKNAREALNNATMAWRAERQAQDEKDRAVKKSIAYELLVRAVEQRELGELKRAFRIAERANHIYTDPAIQDFLRQTYNSIPEQDKLAASLNLNGKIFQAGWLPSGSAVMAYTENEVAIWDWATGWEIRIPEKGIRHAAVAANEQYLATASGLSAKLWDRQSGALIRDFPQAAEVLQAFVQNGQLLAVCADQKARLWSIENQKLIATMEHKDEIRTVDYQPQNRQWLTASYDKTVKLWDQNGQLLHAFQHPTLTVQACFSPDGRLMLAGLVNQQVWLWDIKSRKRLAQMKHNAPLMALSFSKDGRWILSASNDEKAQLWDLSGRLQVAFSHTLNPEASVYVEQATFSPDASFVLTASRLKELRLWSREGQPLADYRDQGKIASIAFAPSGAHFLSASEDGQLKVWKSYPQHIYSFPELGLPELYHLGYEMPLEYWLQENSPEKLQAYGRFFHLEMDNLKRPEENLTLAEKSVRMYDKLLTVKPLAAFSDKEKFELSTAYGHLSWYQLLSHQYYPAEHSARRCLDLYPQKEWVKTNLALAYVLTGRFEKARPIYLSLKNKAFDYNVGEGRAFKSMFLKDIRDLEAAGIRHRDFEKVKQLLEE